MVAIPKPKEGESQKDFVSRCIPVVMDEGTAKDNKQATAICNSMYRRKSKETIKYHNSKIIIKEDDGEFYSEGFVCTTHVDRAELDEYDGTALTKEACLEIVNMINSGVATTNGVGSTRAVSYRHDWVKEGDPNLLPAGMAIPPAELRQTGDGHWGVWVKTHHNKNHELYDKIIYDVKHGYVPGYSIEFVEGQSEVLSIGGKMIKLIKGIKDFVGYAFADARLIANPLALITGFGYREIEEGLKKMEETKMTEETKKEEVKLKEGEEQEEDKKEEKPEDKPEESGGVEGKEVKTEKKPEVDLKEVVTQIKESDEFKNALKKLDVKSRVLNTGKSEGDEKMDIKIKEMDEAVEKGDLTKFKQAAAEYIDENDLIRKELANPANYTAGFKSNIKVRTEGKGLKILGGISVRGTLDITSGNTSSYTQQNVELADLFAPGIIDTFNNQTNLLGFLGKEQHIGGAHYQWKMITNKDPDSNPTFVDIDDTSVMKNYSNKGNYQSPLKIARRGISVTDFINRYAARSLGDLFQLEVDLQMKEMMNDVNAALFAEAADGDGNAPLGLEAVADSTGNATLYGLTRSTGNRLSAAALADTFVNHAAAAISESALRNGISKLEVAGVRPGNIAFVTSPTGRDFLFNLLDGQRRFNTTEAAFGFSRMMVPSYDGIPIIVDSDCTSTATASSGAAIYMIDIESNKIIVGMEPRIVALGKVGAATEAYIEFHFAHVYKEPRKIHMLDNIGS